MEFSQELQRVREFYIFVVTEIVPGPLSISYFIPAILLPMALMIPPDILSHRQLASVFLPLIYTCIIHAWITMGGVDVCSVDLVLWCTFFIGLSNPRADFRRLRRREGRITHNFEASEGAKIEQLPGTRQERWLSEPQSSNRSQDENVPQTSPGGAAEQPALPEKPGHSQCSSKPRIVEETYPSLLLRRLRWVLTIIASTRLYSWLTTSPSHNRLQYTLLSRRPPTRTQFTLSLTPTILLNIFLLHPLATQLALWDPNIPSIAPPTISTSAPLTVQVLQTLVPPLILTPLTHALYAYTALITAFVYGAPLVCLSNCLTGVPGSEWSPHTSPPYFGRFAEVLNGGLSGLWGRWWHQHMRVLASAPGVWLAEVALGQPSQEKQRRRRLRYTIITLTTFSLSGVTHMGMIPPLHSTANILRLKVWIFFFSQGLGVILESFFLPSPKLSESPARKVSRRLVTLAWVLAFLCLTNPLLYQAFDELGWWRLWPPLPPWGVPAATTMGEPGWMGIVGRVKGFLNGCWLP